MNRLTPQQEANLNELLLNLAKLTAEECELAQANGVSYQPIMVLRNGKRYMLQAKISEVE